MIGSGGNGINSSTKSNGSGTNGNDTNNVKDVCYNYHSDNIKNDKIEKNFYDYTYCFNRGDDDYTTKFLWYNI